VASIVGAATQEVEGVYGLGESSVRHTLAERAGGAEPRARGVIVGVGEKEAIAHITFRIIYGYRIPDVTAKIRENVAKKLHDLCNLTAKEVNVRVVGVYFTEATRAKLE
jgi:uncharacterized alkaline shock family protein YloU